MLDMCSFMFYMSKCINRNKTLDTLLHYWTDGKDEVGSEMNVGHNQEECDKKHTYGFTHAGQADLSCHR